MEIFCSLQVKGIRKGNVAGKTWVVETHVSMLSYDGIMGHAAIKVLPQAA